MKSKVFKRNAIILTVLMFVCVAVYLNWTYGEKAGADETMNAKQSESETAEDVGLYYEEEDVETGSDALISDYFSEAKLTRQQARDSAVGVLKEALELETVSQEENDKTLESISVMASYSVSEAEMETLIKAKGFDDCVVFLSDDSVIVAVPAPAEGLSTASVSRITDIVLSETELSLEQIKIIEVK